MWDCIGILFIRDYFFGIKVIVIIWVDNGINEFWVCYVWKILLVIVFIGVVCVYIFFVILDWGFYCN